MGVEKEESFVVFLERGQTPDSETLCPRKLMEERKNTNLAGLKTRPASYRHWSTSQTF